MSVTRGFMMRRGPADASSRSRPRSEPGRGPDPGLRCLLLATARFRRCDQRADELPCGSGNLLDGTLEGRFVGPGRSIEAAQLADELQRRVVNLRFGGRRL